MIYVLMPHRATAWGQFRVFSSYSMAEQVILTTAKTLAKSGQSPDWCVLVSYDGVDELVPIFSYTVVGDRLRRSSSP